MQKSDQFTGVILAGGRNSRFPGEKKAFRKVGQKRILDTIQSVFAPIFKEIILVVNDPEAFCDWDMMVVTDIIPARCALAGLHTGLYYASTPYIYVSACDTPFLNPGVIQYMMNQIEPGVEVVLPRSKGGVEPLSAVYAKSCLPQFEENLKQNEFMIKKSFRPRKIKEIPATELRQFDPQLNFIFNINSPEDLVQAEQIRDAWEKKETP